MCIDFIFCCGLCAAPFEHIDRARAVNRCHSLSGPNYELHHLLRRYDAIFTITRLLWQGSVRNCLYVSRGESLTGRTLSIISTFITDLERYRWSGSVRHLVRLSERHDVTEEPCCQWFQLMGGFSLTGQLGRCLTTPSAPSVSVGVCLFCSFTAR